ncbi:MAG: AAA family ATPase [Rhodospirillaceae bacterium]|nr:AAA family ATPase [Rhodospirillaceae bacterium]
MLFSRYVRAAAQQETDANGHPLPAQSQLVVFPGMELTLGVPCQALLLFDADFPDDMFQLAMTALAITPNPTDEPKTAPVRRLPIESLVDLKHQLDRHHYLRNKYIIFPNVGEDGQFSLIRRGFPGKYAEMPYVGGFVDGDIDRLKPGTLRIIQGGDKEWGNKRIACFQTSDNRHSDHSALGRATTWIKWARPTAEALRQACLAQESRVAQIQPALPSVTITGISASNSAFLGPFQLEFNSQYSALIGGRGTGKSTILEYLRWALCDQPPQGAEAGDTPNYVARRRLLIDKTLKLFGATVDVRFEVHGVRHTVRRDSQTGDLLMKIADDDMRPCAEEEVRRLLPIQTYSQKQLSDVSVRVDELLRFVKAPIQPQLNEIERQLSDSAARTRETHAMVRRHRALTRTLQEYELAGKSLEAQTKTLRASMTGLSAEDRALLDRGRAFFAAEQLVTSWRDSTSRLTSQLEQLRSAVASQLQEHAAPPDEPERESLAAAFEQYRQFLVDASESLDILLARGRAITGGTAPTTTPGGSGTDDLPIFVRHTTPLLVDQPPIANKWSN